MIVERLGGNPAILLRPYGEGDQFAGLLDIMNRKLITYGNDEGTDIKVLDLPADAVDLVETTRAQMVEKIVETDEALMERYLMEDTISNDELKVALRAACIAGKVHPVVTGSALKNKGVQLLLDAIIDFLPSPLDIPPTRGTNPDTDQEVIRNASNDEPLAALVFKIITDPFVGRLAFFRVYSGVMRAGSGVLNSSKDKKERIGRIVRMFADKREDLEEVQAGDIAAILALKDTFTGDTLCDEDQPIVLERITFPEPVISVAVEPKTKADQDKMGIALRKLSEEDPTFRVQTDEQTLQTIISGMGELHLEIIVDRMKREYKVEAVVGRPRVSYRETITRSVRHDETFKRQSGGKGQYARVVIEIEPLPDDAKEPYILEDKIVGGTIPKEFIKPALDGVKGALESGILAGFPVVGVRVKLVDGAFHDVDSSSMAFETAGSIAVKTAFMQAKPILLEPMMKVEVTSPSEYNGTLLGDLMSRRAIVEGTETRPGNAQAIRALVPLGEMFGYATNIRNMSQGRGNFTMEFAKYMPAPKNVEEEIVKAK
jgi:elongation factor G